MNFLRICEQYKYRSHIYDRDRLPQKSGPIWKHKRQPQYWFFLYLLHISQQNLTNKLKKLFPTIKQVNLMKLLIILILFVVFFIRIFSFYRWILLNWVHSTAKTRKVAVTRDNSIFFLFSEYGSDLLFLGSTYITWSCNGILIKVPAPSLWSFAHYPSSLR